MALVIGPILPGLSDPEDRYHLDSKVNRKRRCEFLTGRRYAEYGLQRLACPDLFVGINSDRSPVWPEGFCGSISHSDTLCAAMVARRSTLRSVGLDLERAGSLSPDLAAVVCNSEEVNAGCDLTLIFSAKEAFYKLWSPMTGVFLDFADLSVDLGSHSKLEATLHKHRHILPALTPLTGMAVRLADHLLVIFALPESRTDQELDPFALLHQPF